MSKANTRAHRSPCSCAISEVPVRPADRQSGVFGGPFLSSVNPPFRLSCLWCRRGSTSLEGFHALIAENTLLAKLETEGSVGPHDLLAGKEWCKRRLADDRVFVIPHHHQMAVDLSRPRRRPARGSFTVGVQGNRNTRGTELASSCSCTPMSDRPTARRGPFYLSLDTLRI